MARYPQAPGDTAFHYDCLLEQGLVRIQNLKPDVLMMEPAKDWYRSDAADLLRPPEIWSISIQ